MGKQKHNPNTVCFNCEEKGHISHFCKKKGKGGDQKGGSTNASTKDDDFTFCSSTNDIALAITPDSWLSDSACTSHVVKDHNLFTMYLPTPGHNIKGFGKSPGLGRGTVKIQCTVDGKTTVAMLSNAVHIPDAPFNLISIGWAEETGVKILFAKGMFKFKSLNGRILMERHQVVCLTCLSKGYLPEIRHMLPKAERHGKNGIGSWGISIWD